jgi:hypothetical protein
VTHRDPLELRVLGALTSGVESAGTLSQLLALPRDEVAILLERGVAEGLVTRMDLAGTPAYSLTAEGLELVGGAPGAEAPEPGHDDLGATTPVPTAPFQAVDDVAPVAAVPQPPAPADAVPHPSAPADAMPEEADPARPKVRWRHVGYAAAYVVVGLFVMLLQPVVGLLSIVAGLVLGGFTLRPLLRSSSGVRSR